MCSCDIITLHHLLTLNFYSIWSNVLAKRYKCDSNVIGLFWRLMEYNINLCRVEKSQISISLTNYTKT